MVSNQRVQTDVGLVPSDWQVVNWEDAASCFSSGATPYRGIERYYKGYIKWVSSGELNLNLILDTREHISEEAKKKTNLRLHPAGTFLMAITGLEAAGTRGSCAILGVPATTNQSCMAIYDSDILLNKYLFYFYCYHGDDFALRFCQGTKQQSYTASIVKQLPIALPQINEQQKIITALSDMDELILSLEKLIAKKKNIREGAMQELLTQKKEFPFIDNSEVDYRIGEIGDFYSGLTGKSKDDFGTGNAKYITFLNVLSNSIIDISILERVNVEDGEIQNVARIGDLFFNTSSETPEEVGMCAVLLDDVRNVYLNSFCFGYRIKSKDVDPLFFSYYFNSQEGRKIMSVLAQGSTRYNLSKSYFADTVVRFPKYEKQKLIAQILHDMDTEIESLQSKLEKYRQMKSGMMDELLTGKVRLV